MEPYKFTKVVQTSSVVDVGMYSQQVAYKKGNMPKFVVYEVWAKHKIIEAKTISEAYDIGAPEPSKDQDIDDLNLCNWHVVPIENKDN